MLLGDGEDVSIDIAHHGPPLANAPLSPGHFVTRPQQM
jgi:hypothetical protein